LNPLLFARPGAGIRAFFSSPICVHLRSSAAKKSFFSKSAFICVHLRQKNLSSPNLRSSSFICGKKSFFSKSAFIFVHLRQKIFLLQSFSHWVDSRFSGVLP